MLQEAPSKLTLPLYKLKSPRSFNGQHTSNLHTTPETSYAPMQHELHARSHQDAATETCRGGKVPAAQRDADGTEIGLVCRHID
jgi:hypothetical protein